MTVKDDPKKNLSAAEKRQLLTQLLRRKVEAAQRWEPLSYSQRLYWALQQAAPPDIPVNNEGFAWRVQAEFDFKTFMDMGNLLCVRHPGLCSVYRTVDGVPLQRFQECAATQPEFIDAQDWPVERLNEQIIRDTSRPFDLEHGPLLRTLFYTRGKCEAYIVTAVHHLGLDLWSMVLIMEELKTLYLARLLGMPQTLPAPGCHYRDFTVWQEQFVHGPQGRQFEDYWARQLEGPPLPLDLPTDRPRPARRSYRGSTAAFDLGPEVSTRVKALAQIEQTTLFKILLAAFQVVLGRWSGQEDFLVATRGAGRSRSEFEGVVGCFTNTLPLRADLSGNPTFRELLEQVGRVLNGALEYQDYPFALLTQQHKITRPGEPLCDVCFVLQKPYRTGAKPKFQQRDACDIRSQAATGALFALGDSRIDILPVELRVARYDLELEMLDTGEVLSGWMRYSTDLFEPPTIRRMLRAFETVLNEATATPDRPVGELRTEGFEKPESGVVTDTAALLR